MTQANPTPGLDLEALRADVASLEDAPWCPDRLYAAIRHLVRNCDIDCATHTDLSTGLPKDDAIRCEGPGRYDGPAIARLINAVPALLAEIDRLRAQASD